MNETVQLLKALAEPTRLRIVALCRTGGDLAVSEFVRILGQSQPRVSRHLKLLTEAGALAAPACAGAVAIRNSRSR